MRALIADDSAVARQWLSGLLSGWGHEVIEARDGEEAWRILQSPDAPRLALLDCTMPVISGREVCRNVRRHIAGPYTYLILVTSKTLRQEIVEGLEAGADDYLTKPVDGDELRARLLVGERVLALQQRLVEDTARQRNLEQQLAQARKMGAIGQLAGGIAHDFNNLLTVIRGYTELLQMETAEAAAGPKLKQILNAADQAAALTRQLLAFGRRQVLTTKAVHVNSIISEMEEMLRRLIGEDITLVTSLAGNIGQVLADPTQLQQVILNLAVNARDAMPEGGVLVLSTAAFHRDSTADGRLHAPGEYVMLAVSDSGCGMDEDTKARIFEPFFTTKADRRGTGLGLATVYGIVTQLGGFIDVASAPGRGSTFSIYLPVVQRPAKPVLVHPVAEPVRGTETVLLVEDEDSVRGMLNGMLQSAGYKPKPAGNGPEALRLAAELGDALDVVVTDVVMPGISGTELAQRLQQGRPALPVVFISGYSGARGKALRQSANQVFLPKPFSAEQLNSAIRQALSCRAISVQSMSAVASK